MESHEEPLPTEQPGDIPGAGSVIVLDQAGVVILDGPADLVAALIATDPALSRCTPAQLSGGVVAGALAQLADLAGASSTEQVVFQLDGKGMEMYRQGTLVSQGDGWMRAFGRAADGTFSGQAAIKPLMLAPEQVLTAQLAITTVALTAAIREVQEAVERVEQKVDFLNDLTTSGLVGAVLGAHRALRRRAEQQNFAGTLSNTDWHAIDHLGVQVEQQIETIRSFIRKRMQAALDEGRRISDRRDAITYIRDLSETLKLLTVAQDSLFLFEQLRLIRIREHEPHLLEAAIAEANELLAGQRNEDQHLLGSVRELVAARVEVKALEIHRFMTARAVVTTATSVDGSLSAFSSERRMDYEPIIIAPLPQVSDAVDELKVRGSNISRVASTISSDLLRRDRAEGLEVLADPSDETDPNSASMPPGPQGSPQVLSGSPWRRPVRSIGEWVRHRRGRRNVDPESGADR